MILLKQGFVQRRYEQALISLALLITSGLVVKKQTYFL